MSRSEDAAYSKVVIKDNVDSCLTIDSVKFYAGDKDVTSSFAPSCFTVASQFRSSLSDTFFTGSLIDGTGESVVVGGGVTFLSTVKQDGEKTPGSNNPIRINNKSLKILRTFIIDRL